MFLLAQQAVVVEAVTEVLLELRVILGDLAEDQLTAIHLLEVE
jgi:hypothetical protein